MSGKNVRRGVLACIFLAFAMLVFSVFGRELIPSSLTFHSVQGWRSVSLDREKIPAPGSTIKFSPLAYGPHDLRLEMTNGKTIWITFFHSDTGVDRQINIYAVYDASADTINFRQTITRYETFPGITRTVFTGSTRPERTSAAKPFTLDWI